MNVDEVIIEMFLNSSIENNQKVRLLLYMHESNTLIMKDEEYPYSNNNATGKRLSFQMIKTSVLGLFSIRSRSTELLFPYKIKTEPP